MFLTGDQWPDHHTGGQMAHGVRKHGLGQYMASEMTLCVLGRERHCGMPKLSDGHRGRDERLARARDARTRNIPGP